MDFVISAFPKQADILVLPYWEGKGRPVKAASLKKGQRLLALPISQGDFSGKNGESAVVYTTSGRVVLLGLGERKTASVEGLRRAYAALVKLCQGKKWASIFLIMPEFTELSSQDIARGVAEGLLLTNYVYDRFKGESSAKERPVLLKRAGLVGADKKQLAIVKRQCTIVEEGVNLAKDLVNGNADEITPQYLSGVARRLARKYSAVKATVFDKKRIDREKLTLLSTVGRGSQKHREPAFILLSYRGAPSSKEHTVLVGKGITFDSGGLNLKLTNFIEDMRTDMGGAAAVLGTVAALAALKSKVNATGVIPATENMVGPEAYKPGDVYMSYLGKSVEISNTDAEGRLILADALAYASKKLKPTRVIDFATLTGAIVIALGDFVSGVMSNDDHLADRLFKAGEATYERLWRLPLVEDYRKLLDSDIADIKNCGSRVGASITAALFLKEFVGDVSWAHCDIAATAYCKNEHHYCHKGATGFGVRLMIEFLTGV